MRLAALLLGPCIQLNASSLMFAVRFLSKFFSFPIMAQFSAPSFF